MEPVGLAVGILGITGLFTACIENFDIVVKAKGFGRDFDLLCTQLSLQRIRLVIWGETLGIVPESDGRVVKYNPLLERDDVRHAIEAALHHIRLLLQDADVVTDRYSPRDDNTQHDDPPSLGLTIFRERFDSFKARLRKNQKDQSAWKVTRWAVHDLSKFRDIIDNVGRLLDGLASVTTSIDNLVIQERMTMEIESISDGDSLRLLEQAAGSEESSSSLRLVSTAASIRLSVVTGYLRNGDSEWSGSSQSYRTAPSQRDTSISGVMFPRPTTLLEHINPTMSELRGHLRPGALDKPGQDIAEDEQNILAESREALSATGDVDQNAPLNTPQNQRLMAELDKKALALRPRLDFSSGSVHYGRAMLHVKNEDMSIWGQKSSSFLLKANSGNSLCQRIFLQLRSIKDASVPFISAAPLQDSLDTILASIEGPPDTPFEGGVFWLLVQYSAANPTEPPQIRFHTRVYHPNIDCYGALCADYQQWWADSSLQRYMLTVGKQSRSSWFSGQTSSRYSLGALLTALFGLLADPDVEDPLVPEIAQIYLTDYQTYARNARVYTEKYAKGGRPSPDSITLPGDVKQPAFMALSPTPIDAAASSSSIMGAKGSVFSVEAAFSKRTPMSASVEWLRRDERKLQDVEATGESHLFGEEKRDRFSGPDGDDNSLTKLSRGSRGVISELDLSELDLSELESSELESSDYEFNDDEFNDDEFNDDESSDDESSDDESSDDESSDDESSDDESSDDESSDDESSDNLMTKA